MRVEGVYVATLTPFSSTGEVDWEKYRELLEWQVACGVQGFVPCGTTGENPTVTPMEWRQLVSVTIEVARAAKLKVIAGCGSNSTQSSLEMVLEAQKLGADAALVVTPYYNKPTQRGLIAHYEFLAKNSRLPLILYNVPGRTNVNLTAETVTALFRHPQIIGIKEASGHHAQWMQIARNVDLREKFLLAGDDDAFATILSLGGSGIISASANAAPEQFVKIYELFKQGEWEAALREQKRVLPLVSSLFLETSPAPLKHALHVMKKFPPHLRLPLVPVTEETALRIETALKDLELLPHAS